MATYSSDELREAYEHFSRVSDECAASADYNAFADLFTEDCTYIEHVFGEMHGRDAVRQWIVPLMKLYPNDQMTYTHDWVIFDNENGRVIFSARTHSPSGRQRRTPPASSCRYRKVDPARQELAQDGFMRARDGGCCGRGRPRCLPRRSGFCWSP